MTTEVGAEALQPADDYPVRFTVNRPEKQSRITNFPLFIGSFIRSILLIPHFIILYFFQLAAHVLWFIATFAILFTGRYPKGMFDFYVGYQRWLSNAYAYFASLYDAYPPFGMDAQQGYPLALDVIYPENLSRILNFPILGWIIKSVLLIPHLIVLSFLMVVAFIIVFIAQFAILFSYLYSLTDRYPPFSLS
jgi:hypothetical protein